MRSTTLLQIAGICALLVLQAVFVGWQLTTLRALSHQQLNVTKPLSARASEAKFQIVQVQQYLTDASVTGELDGIADGRRSLELAIQALDDIDALSAGLPRASEFAELTRHLREDTVRLHESGMQMAKAYQQSRAAGNALMKGVGGFDHQTDLLIGEIRKLSQMTQAFDASSEQMFRKAVRDAIIGCAGLAVIIGVLVAVVCWRGYRVTIRTIGGDPALGSRIAARLAEGHLVDEVAVMPGDSQSMLAHLATMRRRWTDIASALRGQAANMLIAAESLGNSANELAEGTVAHVERATSIASNSDDLAATAQAIESQSIAATTAMNEIADLSAGSNQSIRTVGAQIQAVAETVGQTAEQVRILNDRATAIESIVSTIREISDQTNLLALNAAIEAARAGEVGRGFAVVADEVRLLADRTSKSTSSVSSMVAEVRSAASAIAATVNAGVQRVGETVRQAREAEAAMEQVKAYAEGACAQVSRISEAMRAQRVSTGNISGAISQMAAETEISCMAARNLADISQNINAIARGLSDDADFFKLGEATGKESVELF
jgi:methyl-accepting chemotaxis protein